MNFVIIDLCHLWNRIHDFLSKSAFKQYNTSVHFFYSNLLTQLSLCSVPGLYQAEHTAEKMGEAFPRLT